MLSERYPVLWVGQAAAEGISLRMAVGAPAVTHVFIITGAARLMDIYPTVAAALMEPPRPG